MQADLLRVCQCCKGTQQRAPQKGEVPPPPASARLYAAIWADISIQYREVLQTLKNSLIPCIIMLLLIKYLIYMHAGVNLSMVPCVLSTNTPIGMQLAGTSAYLMLCWSSWDLLLMEENLSRWVTIIILYYYHVVYGIRYSNNYYTVYNHVMRKPWIGTLLSVLST